MFNRGKILLSLTLCMILLLHFPMHAEASNYSYIYDEFGRLKEVKKAVAEYNYDQNGNLISVTPPVEGQNFNLFDAPSNYKTFDGTQQLQLNELKGVNTAPGGKNTVEFWMFWDGAHPVMPFSWSSGYDLDIAGSGFGFNTFNSDVLGIPSTGLSNRWVHVAAVFYNGVPSANTNELYIDGVKQTLTQLLGSPIDKYASNSAFVSGINHPNLYRFHGKIANVRIWNYGLSESAIQKNMYRSVEDDAGGLVGQWELRDQPDTYRTFHGTEQIKLEELVVDTSPGGTNTVEFWMYWDGTSTIMPFSWSSGYGLYLAGGNFGFNTFNADILGISSTGLSNKWLHVAAVFYNGVPGPTVNKMYINGKKQNLEQKAGVPFEKYASHAAAISGTEHSSTEYKFRGKMADFKIWNRSLTEDEIVSSMYGFDD